MQVVLADGWDSAIEAFDHALLCVLPTSEDPPAPGLFTASAVHAMLIAAVRHPEWAAAWYRSLAEEESHTDQCEELAAKLVDESPITVISDS